MKWISPINFAKFCSRSCADVLRQIEETLRPFQGRLNEFLGELFEKHCPRIGASSGARSSSSNPPAGSRSRPKAREHSKHGLKHGPGNVVCSPPAPVAAASAVATTGSATVEHAIAAADRAQQARDGAVRGAQDFRPEAAQFFDQRLAEARAYFDDLRRVLEALGDKLDAARMGMEVNVDAEVKMIEELIFRYNDAIESAGEAWLRDNLARRDNERLLGGAEPGPARFAGLRRRIAASPGVAQGLRFSRRGNAPTRQWGSPSPACKLSKLRGTSPASPWAAAS